MRERCPDCNLKLRREEGYMLGSMTISYGLVVFGYLPPIAILWAMGVIGKGVALGMFAVGAFLLPILLWRFSQTTWLALYFMVLPGELPANAAEKIPLDEG